MKARVKATGEIVEVSPYWTEIHTTNGGCYEMTEVDLIHEVPDYWEKLKHQYAGMAMQGILANPELYKDETSISIAIKANTIASTLIDKLKEEEK